MTMAPVSKGESQSSSSKKTSSSARPQVQEQAVLKCPRCDSMNTKFCYFNNYNLTQPRHFCKTCRRYWTKGGALRNVPIGGGCRKNKKMKSSSSSNLSGDSSTSPDIGGLKYFHGVSPAMDFLHGGLNFPKLHSSTATGGTATYNQFSSFGDISSTSGSSIVSTPCFNLDPSGNPGQIMGFSFPFPSSVKQVENDASGFNGEVQEMASSGNLQNNNKNNNIASSIESLSCINQDLHWKLQQQRFAMLFSGENQKENRVASVSLESQIQKPQPILFQNLEILSRPDDYVAAGDNSRKEGGSSGNLATEWFFDNSYAAVVNPTSTNENGSNWNGVQSWSNLNQHNALP